MIARIDAACRYYRQKFPVPVGSGAVLTPEQKWNLDRWLLDYVCPAVSEACKSTTFRSRVLYTRDLLEPGADTDERRMVDEAEQLFSRAADLLESLYEPVTPRKSRKKGSIGAEKIGSDDALATAKTQLEKSGFPTESSEELGPFLTVVRCPLAVRDDFLNFSGGDDTSDNVTSVQPAEWLLSDSMARGLMARFRAASGVIDTCLKNMQSIDFADRESAIVEELTGCLKSVAPLGEKLSDALDLANEKHLEESCLKAFKGYVAFCAPLFGEDKERDAAWIESNCPWLGYETKSIVRAFASLQQAARSNSTGSDAYESLAMALGDVRHLPDDAANEAKNASLSRCVLATDTGDIFFDGNQVDLRTKAGQKSRKNLQLLKLLIEKTKKSSSATVFDLNPSGDEIPSNKALGDRIKRLRDILPKSVRSLVERTATDPVGYRLALEPGEITLI